MAIFTRVKFNDMPKIITLAHQKGGVGKSTLAFNLAHKFKKYVKTAVVDIDPQGTIIQLSSMIEGYDVLDKPKDINDLLKMNYDVIFVDTPPYLSNLLSDLIGFSSLVIVPTKAGIADLMAIRSTIDMLKEGGAENKALVVFNMIKPHTNLTKEIKDMVTEYGIDISKNMISDLVAFTRSFVNNGLEKRGNKTAQNQLNELTIEVLSKINN